MYELRPRRRHAARALLALVLGAAVLAGCATAEPPPPGSTAPDLPVAAPVTAPEPPLVGQTGMSVRIDEIGAESSLEAMGLNEDRTLEVPPLERVEQAGWYSKGPAPGDIGPAIIMGHINGNGRDGVFARLSELAAGDKVTVVRDGRELTFTVTRTQTVDKDRFPTGDVYSDRPGPEIRLITCGGALDRTASSYLSNVIVYATMDA